MNPPVSHSGATSMRTHMCGDLRASDIGSEVSVCGWVGRRREHGEHLAFVDLRDHSMRPLCYEPIHSNDGDSPVSHTSHRRPA